MAVRQQDLNEMDGGGFGDVELLELEEAAPPRSAYRSAPARSGASPPATMPPFKPTYDNWAAQVGDMFGVAVSLYAWYVGSSFLLLWFAQLGVSWAADTQSRTINPLALIIPIGITALQRAFMPNGQRSKAALAFWASITAFGVVATFFGAMPWFVQKVADGVPMVIPFSLAEGGKASWSMIIALLVGALCLEIGPEFGAVYFGRRAIQRGKLIRVWWRKRR